METDPFDEARALAAADAGASISLVESFFETLGRMDFDGVGRFFADDGIYADEPLRTMDAVGPAAVTAKLTREIVAVERFVMGVDTVVGNARRVATRRREEWHFTTGEVAAIGVVCIHEIEQGKVVRWHEFWDHRSLLQQLPDVWREMRERSGG